MARSIGTTSASGGASCCLLSPIEVARRLSVTRGTIYKLVRIGALPAVRLGRLSRISEADLAAFIARQQRRRGVGQ
jgi:excisionase family DNA binding protein